MVLGVDHFFETEIVMAFLQRVEGDFLVVLGEHTCLDMWH